MLITKKLLTHEASYKSCASAAKLRSGGPILPFGLKAKGLVGIPPPRTVIGVPSQADKAGTVGVPSASSVHCAARKTTPSGTMPSRTSRHRAISSLRAKATIMGFRVPRAFSVRDRNHSRRWSSGVEGTAMPIESCLVGPGHCPSGPALSLGVSFRSRRVNR